MPNYFPVSVWLVHRELSVGNMAVCAVHLDTLILWSLSKVNLLEETCTLALFLCSARLWTWETRLHATAATINEANPKCTHCHPICYGAALLALSCNITVIGVTTSRLKINKKVSLEALFPGLIRQWFSILQGQALHQEDSCQTQ